MRRVALVAAMSVAVSALVQTPSTAAHADSTRNSQWYLADLDIKNAHEVGKGDGIVVAVVDTGVDFAHPDLAGAMRPGTDLVELGRDGGDDLQGHGTGIAGLVASRGRGEQGILGIAPMSTVMSVRVSRAADLGIPGNVAAGIEWAAANHAKVVCVASGSSDATSYAKALRLAVEQDVVVVAAAGNTPQRTNVAFPAALPGVLAVGGTGKAGQVSPVSVRGREIAIVAPAEQIVSTDRGGRYSTSTGTSNSAAIVAGAAALVRAKYPNLTAPQVIHRLTATADDKGAPGRDEEYGYGVLNIVRALTANVPPLGQASASPDDGNGGGRSLAPYGVLLLVLFVAAGVAGTAWLVVRRR